MKKKHCRNCTHNTQAEVAWPCTKCGPEYPKWESQNWAPDSVMYAGLLLLGYGFWQLGPLWATIFISMEILFLSLAMAFACDVAKRHVAERHEYFAQHEEEWRLRREALSSAFKSGEAAKE